MQYLPAEKILQMLEVLDFGDGGHLVDKGDFVDWVQGGDALAGVAVHPEEMSGRGFAFGCIEEYLRYNQWMDGSSLLQEVEAREPAFVFGERRPAGYCGRWITVRNARVAVARLSRAVARFPDEGMQLIGVTGTNGKTTTTRILSHLLNRLNGPAASLGTLGLELGGKLLREGSYTTPLAPELWDSLRCVDEHGGRAVAMEVSSHALELGRVAEVPWSAAVLTNLTRDHLDFHGTEAAYAAAKKRLFTALNDGCPAIINADDVNSEYFVKDIAGRVVYYGIFTEGVEYEARDVVVSATETRFTLMGQGLELPVYTRLIGRFQVENILAALATVGALGYDLRKAVTALADFPVVPGRMETHQLPNGATAVVDYAHNPDGLKHLLENCRALHPARILLVFGCGGDRDRGKRPIMGEYAFRGADLCWVTSDNPRTEEPSAIVDDILSGVPVSGKMEVELDRTKAIQAAYAASCRGDILVIAGKGHENYQIVGTEKLAYSDQAVLRGLVRYP